jgi:zinc protease
MRKAAIIALGLLLSINSLAQGGRRSTKGAALRVNSLVTMPTVDAVLEKYVKAIGGKAALLKINSRFSKGTFEITSMAGVKGTLEAYEKAPNKQIVTLTIPGIGTESEGFDGKLAWALEPDSGVVHDKSGLELASAKRDAEFYEEIKLKELYASMTLKGVEKVGALSTYVIEAVPQVGSPERLYFDTKTGLLIRKDSEEEGEEGKRSVEEYYDDYRAVDGIKLPFSIHQVSPGMNVNIKLSEVKQNVPIDDSKFNKPEDQ